MRDETTLLNETIPSINHVNICLEFFWIEHISSGSKNDVGKTMSEYVEETNIEKLPSGLRMGR